jgi:hypothetical protein
MIEVELYAAGGDLVARVQVPGYQPLPEGIVWGERCFFRRQTAYRGSRRHSTGALARYEEGLLYVVPHEIPWRITSDGEQRVQEQAEAEEGC